MKKLIFILFFLLGLTTQSQTPNTCEPELIMQTPSGIAILDCTNCKSASCDSIYANEQFYNLEKWYFFKDCIVGYTATTYFIFNEQEKRFHQYKTKQEWGREIQEMNLSPKYLTRWLTLKSSSRSLQWFKNVLKIPLVIILLLQLVVIVVLIYNNKKEMVFGVVLTNLIVFSILGGVFFVLTNQISF